MPRCKECNEKFVSIVFLQKFCKGSDDCLTAEAMFNLNNVKKANEKKRKSDKAFKISLHPDIYHPELKKELQRWINNIARLIDHGTGCIDCHRMESKAWDGGHRHSRGNMPSLRWNLHNIHNQTTYCNNFSEGNKQVYDEGLEYKYGKDYREFIESLPMIYPTLKLPNSELPGALKEARKIYRELKGLNQTYPPEARIRMREEYNKRIGIYQ